MVIENRKLKKATNFYSRISITTFRFLTTIFQFSLDLIFPKFCVGCSREGEWVCDECREKILPVITQTCTVCGRISKYGEYCTKDRYLKVKIKGKTVKKVRPLNGIIVSCYYEEGPIKEMVHNFKYNNITEIGKMLGEIMVRTLKENLDDIGEDIIVTAVPLHFLRRAQRGYNQSELLAEYVADKMKLRKNFKIIKKIRKTKPQVKFSGKKRRENLKNCYKIFDKNAVRGRIIILVDDVTTTGTTLNECAKVLREAGAKKVWGLVVARG